MDELKKIRRLENQAWKDTIKMVDWRKAWTLTNDRIKMEKESGILSPEIKSFGYHLDKNGEYKKIETVQENEKSNNN